MKALRNILDFFLYSNLFISLCAAAMTAETYLLVHAEINFLYVIFVIVSSVALYNFPVLFFAENETHSERSRWISENKKLISIISFPAFVSAGILLFFFPFKFILFFSAAGLVSLSYFLPVTNLRAIPVVKAVAVALVWTCVTFIFPLLLSPLPFGESWREALLYFFFLLPLAIAFNIRDITVDRDAGVKTFPVIFGIQKTKSVCLFFLLLLCGLVFFLPLETKIRIAFLLSTFATAVLISIASERRSEYFYSLWMDGMILFQFLLVWVLQNFF